MADESHRPGRLRLRRRLLVLGLLPLLVALAVCAKVGVMLALDDRGRSAFADGRFDRAGEAFAMNGWVNVFEPWVSPFDQGTAEYRLADFAGARTLLEQALLVVPGEHECLVRTNLALTLEALGDADLVDGRRDQAQARWLEGIAVLDQGSCRDREPAARSVAARLADKLADRAADDAVDDTDDPADDADQPDLEELEQRNEEAQEQRRKNEETREDEPDEPDDEPDDPSTPPSYSW